ncbi:MAG TPA: glucosidase, partial [Urbifossiella sp.]
MSVSANGQAAPHPFVANAERLRLVADREGREPWRKWGPYLSERQWGTIREDYSANGDAWDFFPYSQAHARTYRWGEDGIAGLADHEQRLCLGLALWNGRDDHLKERLFGLNNAEGNHGEDVKELYYYVDATPSHSYLKFLYKYPQAPFPYEQLLEEGRKRTTADPEFELLDTGIFDGDRYFDVFVEYAKSGPDEVLMRITAYNRGPVAAELHVLPQVWFRNTWSWKENATKPSIEAAGPDLLAISHHRLGDYNFHIHGEAELLFTENETNPRLFGQEKPGHWKDAFHEFVVRGDRAAVNHDGRGTKAAALFRFNIPAGKSAVAKVRLTNAKIPSACGAGTQGEACPVGYFDGVFTERIREANAYYADLQHDMTDDDAKLVQRQAFAGLIWSKQSYHYDVPVWLNGDPNPPHPP